MKVLGDLLHRGDDEAHVRVFGLAQRRGNADVDGVEIANHGEIGGSAEALLADQLGDFLGGNILHMRLAAVQACDLRLQDIDSGDGESSFGKLGRQRQADVT